MCKQSCIIEHIYIATVPIASQSGALGDIADTPGRRHSDSVYRFARTFGILEEPPTSKTLSICRFALPSFFLASSKTSCKSRSTMRCVQAVRCCLLCTGLLQAIVVH